METGESFWQGVKDCIPTLLGILKYCVAAGVVEKTAGLNMIEIALMSLLLYAGSGQFIAAGMIAASHPYLRLSSPSSSSIVDTFY